MKKISKTDRHGFIKKYNIDLKALRKAKITSRDAENIITDYDKFVYQLENIAVFLTTQLQKCDDVHSVRFRIKEAEHLIEKIIRKNYENEKRNIGLNNYKNEVTDLIGIRVLHIFKEDWDKIHNFIINTFDLKESETPKVYYKKGDSDLFLEKYTKKGLATEEHKFGYRSIHYIIKCSATKIPFFAEIQVRTIYEEAWSEIDHRIRYPYNKNHTLFGQILFILNGLSHSADEVGSFINNLKNIYNDFTSQLAKKEGQINSLLKEIEKSNLPIHIKTLMKERFMEITKIDTDTKGDIKQVIELIKNMNL